MSMFCVTLCALLFFFLRHYCKLLFRKVKTTVCFSWKSCTPCSANVFIDIAVTMTKPIWSRYSILCTAIPFWILKPIISIISLLVPHREYQEASRGINFPVFGLKEFFYIMQDGMKLYMLHMHLHVFFYIVICSRGRGNIYHLLQGSASFTSYECLAAGFPVPSVQKFIGCWDIDWLPYHSFLQF